MQRSLQQNKAIHKGCEEIANVLVEHGVPLRVILGNLDVRPTMHSVKDIFRAIAYAKYGVESTADLESSQLNPIWEELTKTIAEATGVQIPFPSIEHTPEYLQSLANAYD